MVVCWLALFLTAGWIPGWGFPVLPHIALIPLIDLSNIGPISKCVIVWMIMCLFSNIVFTIFTIWFCHQMTKSSCERKLENLRKSMALPVYYTEDAK